MSFLRGLKLWLFPLKMTDPDFGKLVYMHISKWPERYYWECEWKFPATGTQVVITLQGNEAGPSPESRRFYLALPGRLHEILAASRPSLEKVYKNELGEPTPKDIFSAFQLTGFGIQDPNRQPVLWDVSFELTGDKYLGISIPFTGDSAMEPEVDIC